MASDPFAEEPPEDGPPNDLAAERAVLGAMLQATRAIQDVATIIGPEDHYRPIHSTIHAAIALAYQEGRPADPVALAQDLARTGDLARIGGAQYLHLLMTSVPTIAQARYYAQIVADRARQRRLIEVGIRIKQAASSEAPDLGYLHGLLIQEAQAVSQLRGAHGGQSPALDWANLLETNFNDVEFITEPLLTPGAQITIIGEGKAGKSLFCFEWACRLATGQQFLGGGGKPLRVLYVDQENSHPELKRRLHTMGFDQPADLERLVYASFAPIGPLDTPRGAADLIQLVDWAKPDVIYLDTISRMIQGPENDADTWLQLYRLSMLPLKERGLACVRLDHFGKDRDRGSRGSSAKTQDVDHVWEMAELPGEVIQLVRTHTRNGIGRGILTLRREGNPSEWGTTRHTVIELEEQAAATSQFLIQDRLHKILTDAGVPWSASNNTVRTALRRMGQKVNNAMVAELVKWRQEHDPLRQDALDLDHEE